MNVYYILILSTSYDEDYGVQVVANTAEEAFNTIRNNKIINYYLSTLPDLKVSKDFTKIKDEYGFVQYVYKDENTKINTSLCKYPRNEYYETNHISIVITEYGPATCTTIEPAILEEHCLFG